MGSFILDVLNNMGRKSDTGTGNATSLVDQYRKQLGRQEKKVVSERRKEIKRLKSEKQTVSYWKVRLHYLFDNK